ncbi:MAG: type VI secretion system baseplate subunit TssG [Planctomycetota bacterium]
MTDTSATHVTDSAPAAAPGLLDRLVAQGWTFDFFQAVWLLERYVGGDTPVGQRGPAARERLRFRPDLSLGFPATDLRRVSSAGGAGDDPGRHLLEVTFLGLYGVSTPLPLHYAVEILRTAEPSVGEEAEAATTSSPVRDFLDVFHHRLISLFYRSWLKYRYERMFAVPRRDVVTEYLRCLIGCPPHFDESTLGVPPIRLLRYAGTLTQRPRSATTLAGLLSDYWGGLPVRVRQFVGRWVPLDEADQNRLGARNSGLGLDLTIGEQVYDLGGTFTIALGPVDWATYLTFVPGGPRFRQTRALTRLYGTDPLGFQMEVTLRPGEVPALCLTSDDAAGALGMTTWVRTRDMGETTVTFDATQDTGVSLGAPPVAARGAA